MKNVTTFAATCSSLVALILVSNAFAAERTERPRILREITIPTIDISGDTQRHVIVAQGTPQHFEAHPHTLLMPDGHTMFCAWQARRDNSSEHGAPGGNLKRSDDGGRTWSAMLDVPDNWRKIGRGSPTIHRLVDSQGVARLFVYQRTQGRETFLHAMSHDEGKTWSPMEPLRSDERIFGWTVPISIETVDGGRRHLMWYGRGSGIPGVKGSSYIGQIWQSASSDGGLTWGESRPVVTKAGACEPAVVRSPDGRQLLMLIRNGAADRKGLGNSLYATSDDEGRTWSKAAELPGALTGDRHLGRYAKDGRLVVVFRDMFRNGGGQLSQPVAPDDRKSHFVAWVGRYEDVIEGREGQCRIKLLHSYRGWDQGYPGLEVLPDGTFVATTYIKYRPGRDRHSVVSTRFKLDELD